MWFHTDLLTWFHNRVLPVTSAVADRWVYWTVNAS